MKKDVYVGVLVGVIIGLLIAIILILLSKSKKESYDYGEVIKRENDYVYIKGNNTTTKITDESLNVGDIIKNENNTTTVITPTKERITTTKVSEEDIINTIKSDYEVISASNNQSFKETAKETFIKIVDFIFYDGAINGVTFKSLSTKTKITVIKYALLIDNKIDSFFPNYKNELSEKYQNIKTKLISEYMNSLAYVCSKNKNECDKLKDEFMELKGKVSITWSNIKDAFKSGSTKVTTSLDEWYKIFKNS